MEINILAGKFKEVIRRMLEEEYEISRYHAKHLLKHFNDNDSATKMLLTTPMFSDLVFHSIENLHKVSTQNKIFVIEVLTVLFKNELQFNRLQTHGLKLCFLRHVLDNMKEKYPSPDLLFAAAQVLTALVSHTCGFKTIIQYKMWKHFLTPATHLKPAYVAKAIYKFISDLVWKSDEFGEEVVLTEILEYIMQPIKLSPYQTLTEFNPDNEHIISEPLKTPLNALLTILKETSRVIQSKHIVPILKMMYFMDTPLRKVVAGSRDHDIICLINDIAFRLYFAFANKTLKRLDSDSDRLNEFMVFFLNQLSAMFNRKRILSVVMDLLTKANIFWFKEGSKLCSSTFERNGLKFEIENQFIAFMVLPFLIYTSTSYKSLEKVKDKYNVTIGKAMTEHMIKHCYSYMGMIKCGDLKQISIMASKEILKLKGLLKPAQAGIVFQCLYYVLELYIPTDDEDRIIADNPIKTLEDVKLLSLNLEAMKMLLIEHNIHWYESVEIVSLQNLLVNLLKHNLLPQKQLQQVLDLIQLSVEKFMSPDMTLLVESKCGSTLDEIATIIKSHAQHEEWEVRESALSLLLSCIDVAFVKYLSLQKLISKHELVLLACNAAFKDNEYYVQTTALQCLASAAKIETLWREVLTANNNAYKQLFNLLRHNPEGMIRREAVNVLTQIYIHQKTTPQFEKCMYHLMSTTALDDLHWEVQISSLYFWKQVIKNQFNNRGMIDGKFPKVTFSREKRKIIVLDEREIKKQLTSILNDLSDVGCLTVLHYCLNDSNTAVMSEAHCITKKLIDILQRHSFVRLENSSQEDEPMDVVTETNSDMILDLSYRSETDARRDQIIEEIVNTSLGDLIMNLNGVHDNANVDDDVTIRDMKRNKINPNTFLDDFYKTDYASLIQSKKDWDVDNLTLDQLLDEVLER